MTNKTIADRINDANDTGKEAIFYSDDSTTSGTSYEFTPSGLTAYLSTQLVPLFSSASATEKSAALDAIGARKKLTANTVIYVRQTGGSDSNDGLTYATAVQTLQKAVDIWSAYDDGGFTQIIQLYTGTYDGCAVRDAVGGGQLWITGNASDTDDVLIRGSAKGAVRAIGFGTRVLVTRVKLETVTSGNCLSAELGGEIAFKDVEFGSCAQSHTEAQNGGLIYTTGDYAISGGAQSHWHAPGGQVLVDGRTVTITGTPNFNAYFAGASFGYIQAIGNTFVGSATGTRYVLHHGSHVRTNTNDLTYLPGSLPGTVNKNSSYDFVLNDTITLTTTDTLDLQDAMVFADATSAAFTITLEAASTALGVEHVITKIDSTSNAVTIDGNASETINGRASIVLSARWQSVRIRCDGTSWVIIEDTNPTQLLDGAEASLTGSTSETVLKTVPLPVIGANDAVRLTISGTITNNANTKTFRLRQSTIAGTAHVTLAYTALAGYMMEITIQNKNDQTSQRVIGWGNRATDTVYAQIANGVGNLNMAAPSAIVLTGQLANSSDTMTVDTVAVELLRR